MVFSTKFDYSGDVSHSDGTGRNREEARFSSLERCYFCGNMDDAMLAVFTVLSLLALLAIYVFTGISLCRNNRLFRNTVGEVSNKYETEITPADYTFAIWNLIFLWQAVWVFYVVVSVWRTTEDGPILMNPDILPIEFYLFWIACCIFYVAWLFLWDREYILLAFIDLLLLTLSGYAAVGFQGVATGVNRDALATKSNFDLTLVYALVQNGTDLFFAWTTVATLLNLSSALTHDPMVKRDISSKTASTISLVILGIIVVVWSILENVVLYEYFQFVYAWYGVLIWATIGILVKNYERNSRNTIITIILLCLAVTCCVIKIGVYAAINR